MDTLLEKLEPSLPLVILDLRVYSEWINHPDFQMFSTLMAFGKYNCMSKDSGLQITSPLIVFLCFLFTSWLTSDRDIMILLALNKGAGAQLLLTHLWLLSIKMCCCKV